MVTESTDFYKVAKEKFLSGDIASAELFFKKNSCFVELAYCKMLSGDLTAAKDIFSRNKQKDLRADWGEKLIQFIEGYVVNIPTYFQIRNFLEIDLNFLIKAGRADYVESIINGADIFYSSNPESYKFIARVMYNNDFIDLAIYYLDKAVENFYYDPEMHLIFANCYLKKGNKQKAKQSINNCLAILPEYVPAQKLLSQIM